MLWSKSFVSKLMRAIVIPKKVPKTPKAEINEGNWSNHLLFFNNSFLFFCLTMYHHATKKDAKIIVVDK